MLDRSWPKITDKASAESSSIYRVMNVQKSGIGKQNTVVKWCIRPFPCYLELTMPLSEEMKASIYAKTITTGDRQLWLLARISKELRLMLPKGTSFKVIETTPKMVHGIAMLQVRIQGGIYDDKEGYLPRTVIHDLGKQGLTLRVGEFSDTLTGISYGGYKTPFDDVDKPNWDKQKVDVNKPPADLDKTKFNNPFLAKLCRFCNGKRSAHRLYETEKVKEEVSKLYDKLLELAESDKPKANWTKKFKFKESGQTMLGVLLVDGVKLAAYSGEKDNESEPIFQKACTALGLEAADHVQEGERLVGRDGFPIIGVTAISVCAAVKLINTANRKHQGKSLLAMSEIWFDPKEQHTKNYGGGMKVKPYYGTRQTIESCDSCRFQVPAMLCDPKVQNTVEM